MYWLWLPSATGQVPLTLSNNEHKHGKYINKTTTALSDEQLSVDLQKKDPTDRVIH